MLTFLATNCPRTPQIWCSSASAIALRTLLGMANTSTDIIYPILFFTPLAVCTRLPDTGLDSMSYKLSLCSAIYINGASWKCKFWLATEFWFASQYIYYLIFCLSFLQDSITICVPGGTIASLIKFAGRTALHVA